MLIGYLIIGLEYALLLAIFGLFMNLIPFIGPGMVGRTVHYGYWRSNEAVWVVVIMVVAQQVESNLITPNVMGKSLEFIPHGH